MLGVAGHFNRGKRKPTSEAPRLPLGGPTLSGAATEGVALTVVEAPYVYGSPTITPTYQWQRDGADISGATSAAYTPAGADVTHAVRRGTIYTNGAGSLGPIYTGSVIVASAGGGGVGSSGNDYTMALGYGAPTDAGSRTQDPTVDAVPYSAGTIYKFGDVVTSGGNYYISDIDFNVGNPVSNVNYWWPCSQFVYVDPAATPGTGVASTNPATAKASPFSTLNELRPKTYGAFPGVGLDVYSVVLLKRGGEWDGALRAQLTKTGWTDPNSGGTGHGRIFFGSYGSGPRPLVRYRNNYGNTMATTDAYCFMGWEGGTRLCTIAFDQIQAWQVAIASSTGVNVGDIMTGDTTTAAQFQVIWKHPSGLSFDVLKVGTAADFVNSETFTTNNGGSGVIGNTGGSRRVTPLTGLSSRRGDVKYMYCEMRGSTGNGIQIGYGGFVRGTAGYNFPVDIIGCEVHDCCTWGGAGAGVDGTGSYIRIIKSTFWDNGRDMTFSHNVYVNDLDHFVFKLNYCYQTGPNKGNHALIIHGGNVTDCDISYNFMYRCCDGIGWNDGYSATAENFTRMYAHHNKIVEMGYWAAGNGQPFDISCGVDNWIYNNLVVNCTSYVTFQGRRLGDTLDTLTNGLNIHNNTFIFPLSGSSGYLQLGDNMSNVNLSNNLFKGGVSGSYVFLKKAGFDSGQLTMKNNWFDTVNPNPIRWEPNGNAAGAVNYSHSTLNSATGQNAGGGQGAANLVDFAGGNYRPQIGSPLKAAGTGVGLATAFSTDFEDVVQSSPPSIGCFV
jgi:hypothetical protein